MLLARIAAQDDPGLAAAKALDDEILKLNALSPEARPRAIHDLAARVRKQPPAYIAALAFNLLADSSESDGRDALQDIAGAMVEAIHIIPSPVSCRKYVHAACIAGPLGTCQRISR